MTYEVVRHDGAAAFLARAEAWLLEAEDRHNLLLGLAYGAAPDPDRWPDSLWATIEDAGDIVGCVIRTPPHKLLTTEMPTEAGAAVASLVADVYDSIPSVLGSQKVGEAISEAWVALRGGSWQLGMGQLLYRLDEVTAPEGTPGQMREATSDDLVLATRWAQGFSGDTGIGHGPTAESVSRRIEAGGLHLWVTDEPVSMAAAHGHTPGGTRIGYVYTPPELRGHGYASALVAELSQKMLDTGSRFCVLYTDASNPTSNALYQRLGYSIIAEVQDFDIAAGDGG